MKAVARFSLAALALGLVAAPASAQLAGLPVVYAPASTGVTIGGMFGRGLNDDSGKFSSAGGMITIGLTSFWVGAGASYFDFDVLKDISFGGQAGYKLPLPPSTPVSLGVVAGVSYMSNDFGLAGDVKTLFVPAGLTIALNMPSTGVSVTPWASPQFRYVRVSNGTSASNSSWGVSGGVSVGLPVGLGIDLALDYDGESKGMVGGAGLHYTIRTPGLGGGGM
jgi:hypothetical protein